MEKAIRSVVDNIDCNSSLDDSMLSPLTKDAMRIANIALSALSGRLRDKALAIAKAIVDYEDEVKMLSKTFTK